MSLSVDDLVSSLNASHIGQEAIDIAALQVRLFSSSSSPSLISPTGTARPGSLWPASSKTFLSDMHNTHYTHPFG